MIKNTILAIGFISLGAVFPQNGPQRPQLDVPEIVSQLGLCNANLVVEQKYTKSLQSEIAQLQKRLIELEKLEPRKPKPE